MKSYLILAIFLQVLVDFFLIIGVVKLTGRQVLIHKPIIGALLGGILSALSTLSWLRFLGGTLWYAVGLLAVCLVVFGSDAYPSILYFLLRLAMGGVASSSGKLEMLLWAALLWCVWLWSIRKGGRYVPIELEYGGTTAKLCGLIDTGNSLRDPVSGKKVLVVGADVASTLTGLTPKHLENPIDTIGLLPGLRLIPYKTVRESGAFLLALPMRNTRIGNWRGHAIVAFAPQVLDENGKFQALIGGAV